MQMRWRLLLSIHFKAFTLGKLQVDRIHFITRMGFKNRSKVQAVYLLPLVFRTFNPQFQPKDFPLNRTAQIENSDFPAMGTSVGVYPEKMRILRERLFPR